MTQENKIAYWFFNRADRGEIEYNNHILKIENGLNYRMIIIFGNRVLAQRRLYETTFEWIGYTKDFDELRIALNQYIPEAQTIDDRWSELWA